VKDTILLYLIAAAFVLTPSYPTAVGLEDLSRVEKFITLRASSYDRSGDNLDTLGPLPPDSTTLLLETAGPGVIRHMWFTASNFTGHGLLLRDLVLRMTWDGAPVPAVEVPLGDFFAMGHGKMYPVESIPVAVGISPRAMNCYWPMPFHEKARIEIVNNGTRTVRSLYYHIDYELGPVSRDEALFHAVFRQHRDLATQAHEANTTGEENYVILETKGEGQYVGCVLFVDAEPGGWWGEGDDMIFIDGDVTPTIIGTGSEDYFGNAWGYSEPFSYPYYGAPLLERRPDGGVIAAVYRWHVPDPVRFRKSIRVTIEHLFSPKARNDYSSVAYWYQKKPIQEREPLPSGEDNHPKVHDQLTTEGRLRVDGTELEPILRERKTDVRCVRVVGFAAHGGGYLELNTGDGAVEVPVPVPHQGAYDVALRFMRIEGGMTPRVGGSSSEMVESQPEGPGRFSVTVGPLQSSEGHLLLYIGGGRVGLDVMELKPRAKE